MMARLGLGFMRLLARLPLPWLRALGWLLGQVLYVLAVPRRKIALRNLQLCFPDASAAQRRAWARETFVVFCQTWLDRSWLWSAPRALVVQRANHHFCAAFLRHGRRRAGAAAAHHTRLHLDFFHAPESGGGRLVYARPSAFW